MAYTLVLTQEVNEARELLEMLFEHEDTIKRMENAETFHKQGDSVVALELDQQVVDIFTKYYGYDHPQTLESQGRLAVSLSNLGQMEEAISVYDVVLEGQIASLGNENQFVAATMGNIAAAYQNIHDAYGLESKHTALAGLRWAQLLARQGESAQALELVKGSIEVLDTDANRGRHAMELSQARKLVDSLN